MKIDPKDKLLKKWESELKAIDRKRDILLKKIYAGKPGKCLKEPTRKLSQFNMHLSKACNYNPKYKK